MGHYNDGLSTFMNLYYCVPEKAPSSWVHAVDGSSSNLTEGFPVMAIAVLSLRLFPPLQIKRGVVVEEMKLICYSRKDIAQTPNVDILMQIQYGFNKASGPSTSVHAHI